MRFDAVRIVALLLAAIVVFGVSAATQPDHYCDFQGAAEQDPAAGANTT